MERFLSTNFSKQILFLPRSLSKKRGCARKRVRNGGKLYWVRKNCTKNYVTWKPFDTATENYLQTIQTMDEVRENVEVRKICTPPGNKDTPLGSFQLGPFILGGVAFCFCFLIQCELMNSLIFGTAWLGTLPMKLGQNPKWEQCHSMWVTWFTKKATSESRERGKKMVHSECFWARPGDLTSPPHTLGRVTPPSFSIKTWGDYTFQSKNIRSWGGAKCKN